MKSMRLTFKNKKQLFSKIILVVFLLCLSVIFTYVAENKELSNYCNEIDGKTIFYFFLGFQWAYLYNCAAAITLFAALTVFWGNRFFGTFIAVAYSFFGCCRSLLIDNNSLFVKINYGVEIDSRLMCVLLKITPTALMVFFIISGSILIITPKTPERATLRRTAKTMSIVFSFVLLIGAIAFHVFLSITQKPYSICFGICLMAAIITNIFGHLIKTDFGILTDMSKLISKSEQF